MIRFDRRRAVLLPKFCRQRLQVSVRGFAYGAANSNQEPVASPEVKKDRKVRLHKKYSSDKIIFSGIQPTGIPHLGNYLGALRQWKQFQDEKTRATNPSRHRLIFSIVDLHALTHSQNPSELLKSRWETLASLMAIGLDPKHSLIFFQSEVRPHAQLMWYLSNVASTGYLSRMTQWKSKLGVSDDASLDDQAAREKLRLGLFSYPVLQAADILLYDTSLVPVGEDQEQHVEFARTLARSFNAQYRSANGDKDFFKIPKALISPAKRIMSLKDPTAKMSKSHLDPKSRILITDSPDEIRAKFKGALTDSIQGISYDPQNRPGVSNLVEILKHVTNTSASCEEIASQHTEQGMRAFKEHVAAEVIKSLDGIRDRYFELMKPGNDAMISAVQTSFRRVAALAGSKIDKMEYLMGLKGYGFSPRAKESEEASSKEKKEIVIREQLQEEADSEQEPDVLPQQDDGVDRPIAS